MLGTPLHPEALIEQVMGNPDWLTLRFPICYVDENGVERATWPARFPMEWIDNLRNAYMADGALTEFEQEYMCRSENAALKTFKAEMVRIAPQRETWAAKTVIVDPARTVDERKSAQTGYVVQSWVGNKLVIYDAYGRFHRPDEIVAEIFKLDEAWQPTQIAVEVDGLEEFLMQPLRNAMLKRGIGLPLLPVRAPKNKLNFITGLQPFYIAGEVEHAKALPELDAQLLQFPKGRVDILNALAYALRLRAGAPVYEDFADAHVAEALEIDRKRPAFLALSARPALTTGALLQYFDGALRIYADWAQAGAPADRLRGIVDEAVALAGNKLKLVAAQEQFDRYNGYGLPGAAKRERLTLEPSGSAATSQGNLRDYLRGRVRGEPALLVAMDARWTLNGLAGGYARKLNAAGVLQDKPDDNNYCVALEAVESFVGWFGGMRDVRDNDDNLRYDVSRDGRRFLTTLPARGEHGRR